MPLDMKTNECIQFIHQDHVEILLLENEDKSQYVYHKFIICLISLYTKNKG